MDFSATGSFLRKMKSFSPYSAISKEKVGTPRICRFNLLLRKKKGKEYFPFCRLQKGMVIIPCPFPRMRLGKTALSVENNGAEKVEKKSYRK